MFHLVRSHEGVGLVDGRRLSVVGAPLRGRVSRVEHDQQAERHQHLAQTFFAVRHLGQLVKQQFFSSKFFCLDFYLIGLSAFTTDFYLFCNNIDL